jgi:D-beta-D-heptose 7-phosphate kinase/D-beta-D-heptose 1-phosphate adenosyltransferase
MAANVYENLIALGVDCDIITNDVKPIKIRYIDETSNHMIIRVDRNDKIDPLNRDKLKEINFSSYEAIVISDYNKGFLDSEVIHDISHSHDIIFLDTKKQITGSWCDIIKFIKINEREFLESKKYLIGEYPNNIIVTMGQNGAKLIYNDDGVVRDKLFPIKNEHPVRDLTGAGDTFLAGLVARYIKDNNIDSAINFANKCAAWAVTQKGVAVVSLEKLQNNDRHR